VQEGQWLPIKFNGIYLKSSYNQAHTGKDKMKILRWLKKSSR
jgi:hypothetical protein